MEIYMNIKKLLLPGMAAAITAAAILAGCQKTEDASKEENVKKEETQKENTQKEEDGQDEKAELPDTVRWFNASYAVLTKLNNWDYNLFGGLEPSFVTRTLERNLLKEWWDVTDRETADDTLDWILDEGHRTDFAEDMKLLEECGLGTIEKEERALFLIEYIELDEDTALFYADAYELYEQYGANAIDGWDYCRALNLLGYYYLAEYYTLEEALDTSLEIALVLQPMFDSWDELIDSYLRGYEYWAETDSSERRKIYEDLKLCDDNPYNVDYHTTLEKSW